MNRRERSLLALSISGLGVGIVALLRNDALIKHPYLRRQPTNSREWSEFIRTLNDQSAVDLTNNVETFTPTWTGFSSAPSGDLSYVDFGAFVIMWTGSLLQGLSNSTSMSISGIPEAIQPAAGRTVACSVINGGSEQAGAVVVHDDGTAGFLVGVVGTSNVDLGSSSFASGGSNKGLAAGWTIIYPK